MFRFSLAGSLLLCCAVQAQAGWADGLFEENTHDFGAVPRGLVVTHAFRLVNTTKEQVVISNVHPSCGVCSEARALQMVLAPGQETVILGVMKTNQFSGSKVITISVSFSQPRVDLVRLTMTAVSRDDISFSSDGLNFGIVKRGKDAVSTMTVTFYGAATQIIEIKSESNYVQPSLEEVRRDGGESSYKINAKLRADTPAGKWFTDLWLKTNNPSVPKLRVPVAVEVESAVAVTPNVIALGKVKVGTETDRTVVLRGARPFRILSITGTDGQIRVREAANDAKNVHMLRVTLFSEEPGELTRTIRITTDLPTGGDVEFNAQAVIVP